MCGIVGYLGHAKAAPVLISELKCLEYRGYDSAGVAVLENDKLYVVKAAGKLANLENLLDGKPPNATVGIGHTRWATHGIPNDQNAHPHMDCTATLAIVHNGIIENYLALRQELITNGHRFLSETDTEVIAHLIEEELRNTGDMLLALQKSVYRLKGAYALGVINQQYPDRIYAVNQHYSLAVGLGDKESYLASDSIAVRQYTNKVLRLEQSEIAEISLKGVKLYSFEGAEIKRKPELMDTNPYVINKEGHKHFLLKEIYEQPMVLRQTLSKYLTNRTSPIDLSVKRHANGTPAYGVRLTDAEIKRINRIVVVACGTAYHAGLVGKHIIESLCHIPVQVEIASETRGRKIIADENTLTVAVSQSGETADTLAALTDAKSQGSLTLGITNRPDSHLAVLSPNLIVTECGIEVSVAATKTFIAQLASFYLLALYLAERKGMISEQKAEDLKKQLILVPALQDQILGRMADYQNKAIQYADANDVVFIGRGLNYPIALEGALKLKELSYIHASGYAAGELKHGPIAVLDQSVPVITIMVPGPVYEKTLSNAQEVRARHAKMIAVAVDGDQEAENIFDTVFSIPAVDDFVSPLLTVLPLQILSYYIADYLGKDVDQPRNLAKSVTVE